MVQIDAVAAQQCAHIFEGGFLAVDVVGRRIVFPSSSRNIEGAVRDDVAVVSFLISRRNTFNSECTVEKEKSLILFV